MPNQINPVLDAFLNKLINKQYRQKKADKGIKNEMKAGTPTVKVLCTRSDV